MPDYEVVERGVIEVRYTITKYPMDDGSFSYDWQTQSGDESDELFYSEDEAIRDVESRYT